MGDELEKFVRKHREEFDSDLPREEVWSRISSDLQEDTGSQKKNFQVWWKVAAVLFLASTAYLLFERNMNYGHTPDPTLDHLSEFTQAEDYYMTLIAEKKAEIAKADRGLLKREFLMEIDRLDAMYAELKRTYHTRQSSDLVVDAMINNLKLRIDILNQQIKVLQKLNEATNESESNIEI